MAKKSAPTKTTRKSGNWALKTLAGFLLIISCLAVTAFTAVHWVERQILNTDNWVTFVTPLPKDPTISNALGTYISDQLFTNVPIQQEITDALPPKASFLAKPLTEQLQKHTTQVAEKAVASDAFQTVWVAANRTAMNRLLNTARGNEPEPITIGNQKFHLNLNGSSGVIREKLGSVAPALFDQNNSKKEVGLEANLKARPHRLHQYIRGMDFLNAVLPTLAIASLLGALAFSKSRRRLFTIFAGIVSGLALLQLIGIKALRPELLNEIQKSTYKPAVATVYDALTQSFRHSVLVMLFVGIVLLIIGILAGKGILGTKIRSLIRADKLSKSKYMRIWRDTRSWAAKNKYYVWLVLLGIVLVYLAFIADITPRSVTNSILVLLGLVFASQIIATPPKSTT